MQESEVKRLSYDFSVKVLKMCKILDEQYHLYDMASQFRRSATSICANLNEADYASSKADFLSKLNISLKEANESRYWLNVLHDAEYFGDEDYEAAASLNNSIINLLYASVKTLKNKLNRD